MPSLAPAIASVAVPAPDTTGSHPLSLTRRVETASSPQLHSLPVHHRNKSQLPRSATSVSLASLQLKRPSVRHRTPPLHIVLDPAPGRRTPLLPALRRPPYAVSSQNPV